jgi:hypothetical protein
MVLINFGIEVMTSISKLKTSLSGTIFGGDSNPTLFATSYIEVIYIEVMTSISGTIFGGGSNPTLFDHLYRSFFFDIRYNIEATNSYTYIEVKNLDIDHDIEYNIFIYVHRHPLAYIRCFRLGRRYALYQGIPQLSKKFK